MDKLKMSTPNKTSENIEQIAKLFPNVITETRDENGNPTRAVDFDILRQALADALVEGPDERYRLDWPGKRASLLKANTPITKTLRPCREESVNFDKTENLYIEGDNFEVLKILQESYLGKVKMIYIDPPYNTGNDFIYTDRFAQSKDEYEAELGTTDEEGGKLFKNTDTNGRFHSDWLSMMYERLVVARDLLKDDGVIFISIDDNEVHNLRKICDEVFGEENIKTLAVKMSESSGLKMASVTSVGSIPKLKEYVLVIKKNGINNLFFDKISKGKWDNEYNILLSSFTKEDKQDIDEIIAKEFISANDIEKLDLLASRIKLESVSNFLKKENVSEINKETWLFDNAWRICRSAASASVLKMANEKKKTNHNDLFFVKSPTNRVYFVKANYSIESNKPRLQLIFAEDNLEQHPGDFWGHIKTTGLDNEGAVPYKNGKKPLELLRSFIKATFTINNSGIVMDFFSGSASTAEAVLQTNQKFNFNLNFIMVQCSEDLDKSLEQTTGDTKKNIKESIDFLDSIGKPHILTEIGKERIRRAGKKILEELTPSGSPLSGGGLTPSGSPLSGGGEDLFSVKAEAMNKKGFINYNTDLKERAREMRKNPTPAEEKLWSDFLKDRPEGYKFTRQKPVGNYIADFYCSEKLLIIEADGKIHENQKEYDKERNDYLKSCGIKVLRFSNEVIIKDFDNVKKEIISALKSPCQGGFRGLDIGFRVYKTDTTNMKDVYYHPNELKQADLKLFESNIKEDRTPEDLLTQVILDLGLPLSLPIETKKIKENTVFYVQENALVCCFDEEIDFALVDAIAECAPLRVVFRDASFADDKDRINVFERFKRLSPETSVKVI